MLMTSSLEVACSALIWTLLGNLWVIVFDSLLVDLVYAVPSLELFSNGGLKVRAPEMSDILLIYSYA